MWHPCVRPDRHPVPAPARSAGCNSIAAQNGRFETAVESGWAGLRRLTRQHVLAPQAATAFAPGAPRLWVAQRLALSPLTDASAGASRLARHTHIEGSWRRSARSRSRPRDRARVLSLSLHEREDALIGEVLSSSTETKTRIARQIPKEPIESGMVPPSKQEVMDKIIQEAIPWLVAGLLTVPLALAARSVLPAVIAAVVDIVWFVYTYVQAQKMNTPAKPEVASRSLLQLWEKCLTESPDGAEDFVQGWFYDAPISSLTREDVQEWLAWGCFCTTWDKLVPASRAEVADVYAMLETRLHRKFPSRLPGQDPVPCMRFTIEPMEWTHKPLLFYAVCQGLLGGLGTVSLWNEGFSKHKGGVFDYWLRMPESEEARMRTPIVFVHGIGVGLVMYMSFIKALLVHDCPIVCVELPWISSNLAARKVPSISEQVKSIDGICQRWGMTKALFVGHSYGTVVLSWMAQHLPSRVAGLTFVDPVVLMLNLKHILFNFLYKHQRDGKISDLIGSELHVNNALRRNFWWYRNIVWASDLQRHRLPSLICLSEQDEIVPSSAVARHVSMHAKRAGADNLVESYVMQGASHGEMLFDDDIMGPLAARIAQHYDMVEHRRVCAETGQEPVAARFPPSLANFFLVWQTKVQFKWGTRQLTSALRLVTSGLLARYEPLRDFLKKYGYT